jgi:hypothetical protein
MKHELTVQIDLSMAMLESLLHSGLVHMEDVRSLNRKTHRRLRELVKHTVASQASWIQQREQSKMFEPDDVSVQLQRSVSKTCDPPGRARCLPRRRRELLSLCRLNKAV